MRFACAAGRPPAYTAKKQEESTARIAPAQTSLMKSPFGPRTERSFLTPRRLESELAPSSERADGRKSTTPSCALLPHTGAQVHPSSGRRSMSSPRGQPAAREEDAPPSAGLFGDVGIKVRTHAGRQLISGMIAGGSAELSQLVMLHDVLFRIDSKDVSSLNAPGNICNVSIAHHSSAGLPAWRIHSQNEEVSCAVVVCRWLILVCNLDTSIETGSDLKIVQMSSVCCMAHWAPVSASVLCGALQSTWSSLPAPFCPLIRTLHGYLRPDALLTPEMHQALIQT